MNRLALLCLGAVSFVSVAASLPGCSREVAHTETDKPRLLGGRTHEESTTVKNPDGTYTTETSRTKTSN